MGPNIYSSENIETFSILERRLSRENLTPPSQYLYLGPVNVFEGVKNLPQPLARSVVTIGNFDGVHVGHRVLIRTLVQEAKLRGVPSLVLTFDPHPVQVLFPDRKLQKIFSREDQIQELKKLGVEYLVIEPFTLALSKLSADEFLKQYIFKSFGPELVIVGYDFSFGANRSGSIPQLLDFAKNSNFELMIIPPQKIESEVTSSSRIRKSVLAGEIELVNKMLERPFYVEGTVESGQQRGRTIGIPTANLKTDSEILPRLGVYITQTTVGGKIYASVTNVGINPTVQNNGNVSIETHILDFEGDIYGTSLKVEFLKRLRDEVKFNSLDDLKKQIKLDILLTQGFFSKR